MKKILIIIQRSNGDVFFSGSLIRTLKTYFIACRIDILINDDTFQVAKLLPYKEKIIKFSYRKKESHRWRQEKDILKRITRKYDISINLTASDRSTIYSILASKKSISAVEKDKTKSWWKKIFLSHYYYFDTNKHIIENNLTSLDILGINYEKKVLDLPVSSELLEKISKKLKDINIKNFWIFHPSAQYDYKIYPLKLRNKLLHYLDKANVPIIVTGGKTKIDFKIKESIPEGRNIINLIGQTSIEEYVCLSYLSEGYIGMDTLNIHISA